MSFFLLKQRRVTDRTLDDTQLFKPSAFRPLQAKMYEFLAARGIFIEEEPRDQAYSDITAEDLVELSLQFPGYLFRLEYASLFPHNFRVEYALNGLYQKHKLALQDVTEPSQESFKPYAEQHDLQIGLFLPTETKLVRPARFTGKTTSKRLSLNTNNSFQQAFWTAVKEWRSSTGQTETSENLELLMPPLSEATLNPELAAALAKQGIFELRLEISQRKVTYDPMLTLELDSFF